MLCAYRAEKSQSSSSCKILGFEKIRLTIITLKLIPMAYLSIIHIIHDTLLDLHCSQLEEKPGCFNKVCKEAADQDSNMS